MRTIKQIIRCRCVKKDKQKDRQDFICATNYTPELSPTSEYRCKTNKPIHVFYNKLFNIRGTYINRLLLLPQTNSHYKSSLHFPVWALTSHIDLIFKWNYIIAVF